MLDLTRLAKIWKLTTSPNPGEAAAARDRAQAIMEREGKTLADVPGLLRTTQASKATGPMPGAGGFTFYDMDNPDHVSAYEVKQRERRAKRSAQQAPERAEVLARYGGSVDAVLAWTEQEQLLRAAVAKWSIFQEPPHQRWTKSVDGFELMTMKELPRRVVRALSEAYPLPTTIAAAAAEFTAWEKRDRDVGLAVEATDDTQLDLPAYFRREVVRRLLETELIAASLDEVLIRQRHSIDSESSNPGIEKAVLRDLETLVSASVQHRPASKPRMARRHKPAPSTLPRDTEANQPDMFA